MASAGINQGRNLNASEVLSIQFPRPLTFPSGRAISAELLPSELITAKLALKASFDIGPFPTTIITIGLTSSSTGVMVVTANQNGNGERSTKRFSLNGNDVDHLLAAINKANFWHLPHKGGHLAAADGTLANIEVSIPNRRNWVGDSIGNDDAVDLSILAHVVSRLVDQRWHGVPVLP